MVLSTGSLICVLLGAALWMLCWTSQQIFIDTKSNTLLSILFYSYWGVCISLMALALSPAFVENQHIPVKIYFSYLPNKGSTLYWCCCWINVLLWHIEEHSLNIITLQVLEENQKLFFVWELIEGMSLSKNKGKDRDSEAKREMERHYRRWITGPLSVCLVCVCVRGASSSRLWE